MKATKIEIPDIDYKYWLGKYSWNDNHKIYTNKNMVEFSNFNGSAKECVELINSIVSEIDPNDTQLLRAVDLINHWGGKTSRMFYSRNKKNNYLSPRDRITDKPNLLLYKNAALAAKKINPLAFQLFKEVYGINQSFSGKHAMFWSNYRLVIIDNKISGSFGFTNPVRLFKSITYAQLLEIFNTIRLQNEFQYVSEVEKALFAFHSNYFLNNNSSFIKKITDKTDINYAIKIADMLNINIENIQIL